jgi:hypothetical protein
MSSTAIEGLRAAMVGDVLVVGDDGYDDARRVWNADVDRRPAIIARCRSAADVSAAVRHAVEQGLELAVRGGAHSISGMSIVDDGLMIDLSPLNAVTVDPEARRARSGGGALLGDLIGAAQEHGLALPIGAISHTGVGGLTLGGGMGWLTRKHGLTIDNLLSAEAVLADGRVVRASAEQHPDLFWALRGGGGNFGVVTEFEFALHPVGPMIEFGMMFWGLDQGAEALRAARDVVNSLPDGVNVIFAALNAPPEPFVPEQYRLQPGYAAVVAGFHGEQELQEVLERFRAAVPPLWEFATPMPYVALQQMLDESNAWGQYYYDKGLYLEDLTDGVIEALVEHVPHKSSPLSVVLLYRLDGAYCGRGRRRDGVQRRPFAALRRLHHRQRAGPRTARGGPPVGARAARRARPALHGGRHLRERARRERGGGPCPCRVRAGEVRAAGPHQARVRPRERLSPQREHPAGYGSTGAARARRGRGARSRTVTHRLRDRLVDSLDRVVDPCGTFWATARPNSQQQQFQPAGAIDGRPGGTSGSPTVAHSADRA